ncbi:PKD domain-containing protein [bacterium]|jgi:PKD repeat protein|nr:PKD domain-containing protein [bacterium]MBT6831969.1 PKD domain-containing protein [bacterium]MBT6996120.1 PKD domain-containing protein [bacterium]MBT7772655.1 PKD domain-containing protein [bacterium]
MFDEIPSPVNPAPEAPVTPPPFSTPEKTPEPAPESPEKTPAPKERGGRSILVGFFAVVLGLFCVFYSLLLWGLLSGNLSNPLFETLGIEGVQLQLALQQVTDAVFGFFALIFLVMMLIKFFQWVMVAADNSRKKIHGRKTGVFLFVLIVVISAWITFRLLIQNAEVAPATGKSAAETSLIVTDPINTIGLTVPKTVKFDIGEKLFQKIEQQYVRQVSWDLDGDGEFGDAFGTTVTYRYVDRGAHPNGRFVVQSKVVYFSPSSNAEKEFVDSREIIILNEAVTARISPDVDSGQVPLTVTLSAAESVDPDGSIVTYEWDLDGDGTFEISGPEQLTVQKTFSLVGDYSVRLRVTGRNNDYSVAEQKITTIAADETIRAEITSLDSAFSGLAPLKITLDGAQSFSKNGGIVKFEWQVEDEEKPVLGRKIQREFSDPGEYEITLTVENAEGESDQATQKVEVFEKREVIIQTSPAAKNEEKLHGTLPFTVIFDSADSQIPHAVEWRWDFDSDGIIDNFGPQSSYTFRAAGSYDVTLTIIDSENQEFQKTSSLVVDPIDVVAKISAVPASGVVPLTVNFDGAGSVTQQSDGIIDFIWEFPDGEPLHSSANVSYEFTRVGIFPVKMTVLTSSGKRATTETFIAVRAQPLKAEFSITPSAGAAPLQVSLNPLNSTGAITEYLWDFGDGTTSRETLPKHTYAIAGEYVVKLRVSDGRGVVSQTTETVVVKGE